MNNMGRGAYDTTGMLETPYLPLLFRLNYIGLS